MSFAVRWDAASHREWRWLWGESADSGAVRAAGELAERQLAEDPFQGRNLSEGLWQIIVPPLVIYHSIDTAAQLARIDDVIPIA